jgi:hypothetical protein
MGKTGEGTGRKTAAVPLSGGDRSPGICWGGVKNARSWIARGWSARSERPGSGARCSSGIEHGTSKDGSDAGDRESVGWLRLGLAPRTRSLEPEERWMGSAALRARQSRRVASVRWLGGSVPWLWRLGRSVGALRGMARCIRRLGQSVADWVEAPAISAGLHLTIGVHPRNASIGMCARLAPLVAGRGRLPWRPTNAPVSRPYRGS